MKTTRDLLGRRCPQGWAFPGALQRILVHLHPAFRHVAGGSALPALLQSLGQLHTTPSPAYQLSWRCQALWQCHTMSPYPNTPIMAPSMMNDGQEGLSHGSRRAQGGDERGHTSSHMEPLSL